MTILLSPDGAPNGAGPGTINVLIVEANAVTRSCTAAALDGVVKGLIQTAHALSGCAGTPVPDVVIFPSTDLQTSALVANLKDARHRWPDAALIGLVDLNGVEPLLNVLAAGARVILPTSADGEAIALAIRLVGQGMAVVPGDLVASLGRWPDVSGPRPRVDGGHARLPGDGASILTRRQRQVLELLAQGLSNKAIAAHLAISESTVKVHMRAIMAQSGVASRTQIVAQLLAGENSASS